jgi:hypothetical protein
MISASKLRPRDASHHLMLRQSPDCDWEHISEIIDDPDVHSREILNLARQACDRDLERSKQVLSRLASHYNSLAARLHIIGNRPRRRRIRTATPSTHSSPPVGDKTETKELIPSRTAKRDLTIAGHLSVVVYNASRRSEKSIDNTNPYLEALIDDLKRENVKYLGFGVLWKRKHNFLQQILKSMMEQKVDGRHNAVEGQAVQDGLPRSSVHGAPS